MGKGLVAATLVLALSACAMSQITSPFRSSDKKEPGWTPSVSEERLLEAAQTDTTGQIDMGATALHCPRFTVSPQARIVTIYDSGRVGDGLGIQHRGEITKTARECRIFTDKVEIKYGFAGRVLLGPRGKPGTITLPATVQVTDRTRNVVSSQQVQLSVTISPGNPIGFFSVVQEIAIPLPAGVPPSDYRVFVAFDRNVPGAG